MTSTSASTKAPGAGWSNGSMPQSMFPLSRNGKLALYSHNRRWIGLHQSWTRIGSGSEFDARHSSSATSGSLAESPEQEAEAVKALIAQLCEQFYRNGWATGTGGGVSIRIPATDSGDYRVFVAPSGIQKEDMIGEDVFELNMEREVVVAPKTPNLRQSACTPLWYVVYKHRPSSMCVIHTHSLNAQMATLLNEDSSVLRITHLEMLKGVGNHAYDDILEIPIIDNRPSEDLLAEQLEQAIQLYPKCNAVLVRRHGLYVWGDSWEQAKTQCESFDYLFESAVRMHSLGLDPAKIPTHQTYRVEENQSGFNKKRKLDDSDKGFRGKDQASNQTDVGSNVIPLVPRNSKLLLLDIEGCTTSIAFVKQQLFPYVVEHVETYLDSIPPQQLRDYHSSLLQDLQKLPVKHACHTMVVDCTPHSIGNLVKTMVSYDVKATGLKALQGDMWKAGYHDGSIQGHVYPDFKPMLEWCRSQEVKVYIYSSGSIAAQKLLFGHSVEGNLNNYLSGYFDTTSGSKREAVSYVTIAKSIGMKPSDIVFCSDAEAELVAAREAGIGHVVMTIRPGNEPLSETGKDFVAVHSLMQLCGL